MLEIMKNMNITEGLNNPSKQRLNKKHQLCMEWIFIHSGTFRKKYEHTEELNNPSLQKIEIRTKRVLDCRGQNSFCQKLAKIYKPSQF
jgi:hypothetical protein